MKINIIGKGVFGTFLSELLVHHGFELSEEAETVILAIPISAYNEVAQKYKEKYLINVCSVQLPSSEIIEKHTKHYTSIHPLFGPRTPVDKRHAVLTHTCKFSKLEEDFLDLFSKVSSIMKMGTTLHDFYMLHTHVAALQVAEFIRPIIKEAEGIDDDLIPHSFRLLRQFFQTLEDMPEGTLESIKANPYIRS